MDTALNRRLLRLERRRFERLRQPLGAASQEVIPLKAGKVLGQGHVFESYRDDESRPCPALLLKSDGRVNFMPENTVAREFGDRVRREEHEETIRLAQRFKDLASPDIAGDQLPLVDPRCELVALQRGFDVLDDRFVLAHIAQKKTRAGEEVRNQSDDRPSCRVGWIIVTWSPGTVRLTARGKS